MSAYVIVEIEIYDPVEYEEYKKLTPASIAAYDGRFVVRGAQTESMEGDWNPQRIVVLEFPSVERAKEWGHQQSCLLSTNTKYWLGISSIWPIEISEKKL